MQEFGYFWWALSGRWAWYPLAVIGRYPLSVIAWYIIARKVTRASC